MNGICARLLNKQKSWLFRKTSEAFVSGRQLNCKCTNQREKLEIQLWAHWCVAILMRNHFASSFGFSIFYAYVHFPTLFVPCLAVSNLSSQMHQYCVCSTFFASRKWKIFRMQMITAIRIILQNHCSWIDVPKRNNGIVRLDFMYVLCCVALRYHDQNDMATVTNELTKMPD